MDDPAPDRAPRPPKAEPPPAGRHVARASAIVAAWTLLSRATGFIRVAVVAAVLGPTYLGNTYGATNYLPNLALDLVSGSLLGSLLVPPLVRALDGRGRASAERLAGAFLGVVIAALSAVAVAAALAAPLLLTLLAAGVSDREVAGEQLDAGRLLLALQVWQIPLYGLVQVATAAQTAGGRFALAAGAPIVENLGIVAVMGAFAVRFGTGPAIEDVGTGELVLLGGGSTAAVALHAAVQWWGARHAGLTLRPRLGWREPEVREVLGRLRTTLRLTALTSSRTFGALIVANTVAGGVVAFQIGLNFLWLPTALAARPLAVALQPVLSRLHHRGAAERFAAEYLRGLSVVLFLALPMTALYVALAEPIARVVASGQFDSPAGLALLSATLAGLGLGVAGDSAYVLSLYASFARDDVRSPYLAMLLGAAVGGAGMVAAAVLLDGRDTLLALGLAYALSNSVAAWRLARGLAAGLVRHLAGPGGPVLRALAGSAAMLLAAYPLAVVLPGAEPSRTVQTVALAAAVAVAAVVYAGVQRLLRSPELGAFTDAVRRRGGRSGEPEHGAAG